MKIMELLDSVYDLRGMHIVETGCLFTRGIARWVRLHKKSKFDSIDLNANLQEATHADLESEGIAQYCTFRTQEPVQWLRTQRWVDAAFLNPTDLQNGLEQFHAAASAGACLIVIPYFQLKAAHAVRQAQNFGWAVETEEENCILRNPLRRHV